MLKAAEEEAPATRSVASVRAEAGAKSSIRQAVGPGAEAVD
jgi:hypothetical protein